MLYIFIFTNNFDPITFQIQGHLKTLTEKYEESVSQRESLIEHQRMTTLRLHRADILIHALADEKVGHSLVAKLFNWTLFIFIGLIFSIFS